MCVCVIPIWYDRACERKHERSPISQSQLCSIRCSYIPAAEKKLGDWVIQSNYCLPTFLVLSMLSLSACECVFAQRVGLIELNEWKKSGSNGIVNSDDCCIMCDLRWNYFVNHRFMCAKSELWKHTHSRLL